MLISLIIFQTVHALEMALDGGIADKITEKKCGKNDFLVILSISTHLSSMNSIDPCHHTEIS